MCGIAGMIRFDGGAASKHIIDTMTDLLRHRGPDDEGCWLDGPVGLGHRRLSIIDLAHSHQPMSSADGRWTIVFNGEIFNYRELRSRLTYPFTTAGDTETLVAGISCHGIDFVRQLVGQFAFAAFDRATGTVHLVRDRMGVLPLVYWSSGQQLLFASETKAILAAMPGGAVVDERSLDAYLAARSVPAPHTLFRGVSKVPPAHRVEITLDGSISSHAYWQPPEPDDVRWTPDAAIDAVDRALDEAVRSALVADVPVGAYLSGGVDSSLIVAKAAALAPGTELKTFAAGFGDPRHDELTFARRVSEHVGSSHHEVPVDAADFEALWPLLTWHRDAPVSEPADIAVYRLAQAARREVSVVLSGEGGDELFGGYPKYRAARAMAVASRAPAALRRGIGGTLERSLPAGLARHRIVARVWAADGPDEQLRTWFAPFNAAERRELLGTTGARTSGPVDATWRRDPIRAMQLADLRGWLPDNLLERGDRMSMAASLELRPPLLDHRLVELALRLPSSVKVRERQTKWVLKQVALRLLPAEIVHRRKVGFRVPLDAWFRSTLRDSVRERLTGSGSFVAEHFDRQAVQRILDRHDSGRFNEESRIFTLMSLQVWYETFFQSDPSVRPAS